MVAQQTSQCLLATKFPMDARSDGRTSDADFPADNANNAVRLTLPALESPVFDVNEALRRCVVKPFNTETVCAALQHGCSVTQLSQYMGSYDYEVVKNLINIRIRGTASSIFYSIEWAIKHDNDRSVSLLLEYGADPNVSMITPAPACRLNVLAFAIIRAEQEFKNSLNMIKRLLSAGARPTFTPTAVDHDSAAVDRWIRICDQAVNVSNAYFLNRAQQAEALPSGLKKQLAGIYGVTGLLTIDNYLVGQRHAIKLVKDAVFAHVTTNSQHPLLMAFVGPSGHGKTEIASRMGELLSLEITVVDCAHMKHDTDLFGSRNGFKRSEEGSQLNNFLAKHTGQRAVIFLDELDKTPQEIRHSLLLICDSGLYYDRRNNKPVDCSKTLWILATNLGDEEIKTFHQERMERKGDTADDRLCIDGLQGSILDRFKDVFGPPFTGRVDVVVPFLPFDHVEQVVMAHGLLLSLCNDFRQPVDCRPSVRRYIGHAHLDIGDGMELAQHIAATCYNPELGARSLKRGIEELKRKFVMAYCDAHPAEVTDAVNAQRVRVFRAHVRRNARGRGGQDVVVVVVHQGEAAATSHDDGNYADRGVQNMHESGAGETEQCETIPPRAFGRMSIVPRPHRSPDSSISSTDNDDDRFLRDRPQPPP